MPEYYIQGNQIDHNHWVIDCVRTYMFSGIWNREVAGRYAKSLAGKKNNIRYIGGIRDETCTYYGTDDTDEHNSYCKCLFIFEVNAKGKKVKSNDPTN